MRSPQKRQELFTTTTTLSELFGLVYPDPTCRAHLIQTIQPIGVVTEDKNLKESLGSRCGGESIFKNL